ncbi:MAG TPA: hypothetical protein GX708_22030 [Gallicola sp.]|nr:hypothetical protein [Gallicola sp.]
MKIKVYNDNQKVFEGKAQDFLQINGHDPDIKNILEELGNYNTTSIKSEFFSGTWEFVKVQKRYRDRESGCEYTEFELYSDFMLYEQESIQEGLTFEEYLKDCLSKNGFLEEIKQ